MFDFKKEVILKFKFKILKSLPGMEIVSVSDLKKPRETGLRQKEKKHSENGFEGIFGGLEQMITYMIGDDQPERQQRVQQFRSQSSRASHQQQNPTNKYSNSPPIRNQMHSEAQVHRIEQNAKNRNEGYRAESPAFGRDSESEYQQHYPTQYISNLRDIAVNRDKAHDAQLDKRSPTAFAGGVAGVDRNHLSVSRSIAGNSGLERNSHSLEAIRGQHPIFRDNVRPDEVRASRDNLRNTGGIGLLLSAFPDKGMVLIDEVVPGAPAAFDGRIQPRDRLLSVDGADVTCRDAATITRLIAGSEGSIVTLDLAECRSGARYKVELVRQRVNPPPFPQTTPRPGPPPTSAAVPSQSAAPWNSANEAANKVAAMPGSGVRPASSKPSTSTEDATIGSIAGTAMPALASTWPPQMPSISASVNAIGANQALRAVSALHRPKAVIASR